MKGGERQYNPTLTTDVYYWHADAAALLIDTALFTVTLIIGGQTPILLETFTNLVDAESLVARLR
jgi:hypothetical protein